MADPGHIRPSPATLPLPQIPHSCTIMLNYVDLPNLKLRKFISKDHISVFNCHLRNYLVTINHYKNKGTSIIEAIYERQGALVVDSLANQTLEARTVEEFNIALESESY